MKYNTREIKVTQQYLENITDYHIKQGNKVVFYGDPPKGAYIELSNRPLYMEIVVGYPVPEQWRELPRIQGLSSYK